MGETVHVVPVVIRAATDADLPDIAAIYSHHVLNGLASFELEAPSVDEMRSRYRNIVEQDFPYVVAERGGRIAGYAYASWYRMRPAYRFTVENSVYIDATLRRSGVGRALLESLILECERRGYHQMLAVIGDSANDASIGLHAACGFERVALLPAVGWKFGRWVDSIFMQRALGGGDRIPPPNP